MELFLLAFGLGIAFAAPPGAVTAESIRRGISKGFLQALLVQLGSLIGDATWALIALIGLSFFIQNTFIRVLLGFLGILFLFKLSYGALKDAWIGIEPHSQRITHKGAFATGTFLSLANPFAIAFWLGIGSSIITAGIAHPKIQDFAIFFSGFMLSAFLYCFFIATVISYGRKFVNKTFFRLINLVCGLFLLYLGIKLLLNTLFLIHH